MAEFATKVIRAWLGLCRLKKQKTFEKYVPHLLVDETLIASTFDGASDLG